MMRFLYNFFFTVFFIISAPYYFLKMWRRGGWQKNFAQRFGRYGAKVKQAITNRHMLWIHAVSVGEVNVCTQLIRALEPRIPNIKVIVSTTTSTGMGELQRKLPSHILKIYYPIDRLKYVRRALGTMHPEAIVLIEAEIWPNFLWHARSRRMPLFLVNARLSDRSYRGYHLFGFLFKSIFASFTGVGAQNESDAAKLRSLGCRRETIHVVGSLKFDAAPLDERRLLDVSALLRQLGVPTDARLLVGGSTHAGEEIVLAEQFLRLRRYYPDLFLVLVPRHCERGKEVGRELNARGVKFVYRSEISVNSSYLAGSVECLLVNTTGELKYFYEQACVIFVGKSLTADGGQNPIEPGALGKAMIMGPNMQNFLAIAEAFVEAKAAIQVHDAPELEQAIRELLGDPSKREVLGRNARRVVRENRGAIDRTVDMIVKHLEEEEMYVQGHP